MPPQTNRNWFFVTSLTSPATLLSQATLLPLLHPCSSANASGILRASHFSCGYSFCLQCSTPDYQMATLLTCSRFLLIYHFSRDTLLRNALNNSFKITTTPFPRAHNSILCCFLILFFMEV